MRNRDRESSNLSHPGCCYQMLTKTRKQELKGFAILELQGAL